MQKKILVGFIKREQEKQVSFKVGMKTFGTSTCLLTDKTNYKIHVSNFV